MFPLVWIPPRLPLVDSRFLSELFRRQELSLLCGFASLEGVSRSLSSGAVSLRFGLYGEERETLGRGVGERHLRPVRGDIMD